MAEELLVARRENRILNCPKCRSSLKIVLNEDVEVDACEKCEGIWVDLVEEKDFFRLKPEVFTVDELRRLRALYKPLGKIEKNVRYLRCPVCGELMYRKNWGSHSGVIVDKCYRHGVWYDQGEADKIREFISHGGIEWEKLRIAEGGLRDLESKLSQQSLRLDKKIDSAYRRARLWSLIAE